MTFTAIAFPERMRLHWRLGALALLLLMGAACTVSKRPGGVLRQEAAAKADAATRAHIVDAVEPLYRTLFPKQDVLRFIVTPGLIHPHKINAASGWMVECYDEAGREIAHGLWDEQGRRHIVVSRSCHRHAPSALPLLSAAAAVQTARDWLCHTGMAVPQSAEAGADGAKRLGEIWHVNVRLSDGVVMVWVNALTGEVHQAIRVEGEAASTASGIRPGGA